MYKTSDKFNSAVCGDGRTFYARISDGTHEVTSGILSVKQTSRSVPDECITVGGAVSSYVEVEMIPPSFSLDNAELNVSIGMLIDGEKEWVPLGLFTVQKPKTDSGVVKFTAYDRIQSRMNGMYASELTYPCDGKKVLAEISKKTGVPVDTSNLPDGVMIPLRAVSTESTTDDSGNKAENTSYTAPFDGYTYREAVAYIAQLYGMFSTMDRAGNLAFRWYTASNFSVSASRYYDDLTLAETVFSVEKITCQAGNDTFSAGDGNVCISLENPVMTQDRLTAVHQQIKGLEFLPASVSFLGDPRIDVGDIITIIDKSGNVVKIPVMSLVQDYDGGLLSEIQSFGKSEVTGQNKGPTAQKLDRAYTDLFLVKEMVGEKANFDYVYGLEGKFKKLSGDYLSFKSGEFEDLKAKQADFETSTAKNFSAQTAQIKKISGDLASFKTGDFESLKSKQADFETATAKNFTATSARIDTVTGDLADYKKVVAENFSAANGKIENLETTTLKAADAKLTYATIESLNALKGDITDLNVGSLTARVATIEGAYISKTETKQLLAGYADIKLANVAAGTIGSALIGDGAITDAKIASVSANKLTAGTIDASKINVMNLNADNLTVGTINGQRIGDKSIDLTKLSKEVPTKEYLDSVQNGLQNQIDSAIQTYTSDTIPTLKNSPAVSWTDNSTRAKHIGDICYVTNAGGDADGYCYRFTNTGTSAAPVYEWLLIKDSDVNKALQELVTVNGDLSGLKTFQSETSSWRKSTDTEISSVKTRTTTIETTYSTKEETKTAADSAKSSAIESAKGYTDTATKDMATSTAVANAKKEAIDTAAKDATSKADAAKSSAISAAASDATKKADAAKSSAISAASSDATSKANTAKSEAISAAASDATTKANAALNSAKGYADNAVDNIAIGGRNLLIKTNQGAAYWSNSHANGEYSCESITWLGVNAVKMGCSKRSTNWKMFVYKISVEQFKKLKPGGSYVLSYDTDGGSSANFMDLMNTNTSGPIVKTFTQTAIKTNYGYHYTIKIVLKDTLTWANQYVYLENNLYPGISVIIANLKLEEGNKATPWTPAPEDIEEAINTKVSTTVFNEVKQTVDTNSATITKLSETVTSKADGSSVTALSNTVNSVKQTADSNTAAISGLQTTVSKKADSSTVETVSKTLNTVKQTADSNSANISELSKTVSTKADGSSVTELTTRMSNAEQNLDGFKTTVSKTYVTSQTYNEKVGSLESGISAAQGTANTAKSTADSATTTANTAKSTADTASKTASAAKSTAEGAVSTANTAKNTASSAKSTADSAAATANSAKSTADGAVSTANSAKSTADAAKSSVDNLEIGGRNLFRRTDTPYPNNDYLTALYDYASEPLVAGETYTVTICVTPAENVGAFFLYLSQGYKAQTILYVSGTKKQIISKTFVASYDPGREPSVNPRNGTAMFFRHPNDGTVTGNSTIHWVKIEKGNKATDWTPAPEDAIDHQYTQYYRSTSTTTPTGGTWQDTIPDLLENTCIWTRQAIVHVGGDIEYSDPVLDSVTKKVVSMSAEVTKTAEGLTSTANKVTTLTNDLAGVSTRLGTAESKISQNAESISAKVSTTDFNAFKTSNTTAINDAKSSAISTAASDATKKANDAKSSAISTAASDATTKANNAKSAAISTAASDATTKANNALTSAKSYSDGQINTVNAAITQTNTEISAMKGQIALKVEQTDINKAIDGVTVGGRNLATKTNQGTTGWDWSMQKGDYTATEVVENGVRCCKLTRGSTAQSGWSVIEYFNIGRSKWEPDTTYTVSVDVKASCNTNFFPNFLCGDWSSSIIQNRRDIKHTTVANAWTKLVWIVQSVDKLPTRTDQNTYFVGMDSSPGAWYQFRNFKIEKGNKATDWTPAPEDDEERLSSLESWKSEASLKITKDGIIGTVGSYYATGADVTNLTGRVTQAESTIKQQSDSIALTVKKDGVISAINQTSESVKISANKISLTAAGLVEIINSGDTKIKAANLNLNATDVVNIINSGTTTIKASKLDLSASDVVNIINSGTTKIEASKLNLSGYVTVSDLSGSGTTTIDGSNIKTGKISTDRLDVNDIFAKDVTATGTITGATLTGAAVSCSGSTGVMELRKGGLNGFYVTEKDNYRYTYGCAYTSTSLSIDYTKESLTDVDVQKVYVLYADSSGVNIGNLANFSISEKKVTFNNQTEFKDTVAANGVSAGTVYATAVSVKGDISATGNLRADGNITTSMIELYAATPFIDFHFDGNSAVYTSRIIENASGILNINGSTFTTGGSAWSPSFTANRIECINYSNDESQVHAHNNLRDVYLCASSSGRAGIYDSKHGWIIRNESDCVTTYVNTCMIKNGKITAAANGMSWLNGAQPGGASFESICTDAGALVPGWRVRTADGAWVGASYALDPGFRIYYCNASRLAGSSNGTDAVYTFGSSGIFYAKSVSQTSDEREKNIISGITEKYENLFMRLKPILFNWKTGADGVHMGFGAQSTLKLAEKCGIRENELAAVHKSETEEPWSMSYTEIVPLTVQMVQKAITSIDSTRKEVSALEQNMTARMESLQYQLAQAFDRIAALEKENKSLRQALS